MIQPDMRLSTPVRVVHLEDNGWLLSIELSVSILHEEMLQDS